MLTTSRARMNICVLPVVVNRCPVADLSSPQLRRAFASQAVRQAVLAHGASFAPQCQGKVRRLFASKACVLTAAAAMGFSSIAAQRSASTDLGFADPIYAVNWNDHSGQSLFSPMNVGALPIVRMSTKGTAFGEPEICILVTIKARAVWVTPPVIACCTCLLASEVLPWLMSQRYRQRLSMWVQNTLLHYHV